MQLEPLLSVLMLVTSLEWAAASAHCEPYEGPHLNESAWQTQVEARRNLSDAICRDMTPRRCDPTLLTYVEPQKGPAPYNIKVSSASVGTGERLTVTVQGSSGFRSAYLQARQRNLPVGTFLKSVGEFTSDCCGGRDNAIVHANNFSLEYNADITWTAPDFPTRVVFYATISRSFSEFWVGVASTEVVVEKRSYSYALAFSTAAFHLSLFWTQLIQ